MMVSQVQNEGDVILAACHDLVSTLRSSQIALSEAASKTSDKRVAAALFHVAWMQSNMEDQWSRLMRVASPLNDRGLAIPANRRAAAHRRYGPFVSVLPVDALVQAATKSKAAIAMLLNQTIQSTDDSAIANLLRSELARLRAGFAEVESLGQS